MEPGIEAIEEKGWGLFMMVLGLLVSIYIFSIISILEGKKKVSNIKGELTANQTNKFCLKLFTGRVVEPSRLR